MTVNLKEGCNNFFDLMKRLENEIVLYIDDDTKVEEGYENAIPILRNMLSVQKKENLKHILFMIATISNYHHRAQNFFFKIEQFINYLRGDILQNFTNFEIFDMFRKNKRILLYLVQQQIVIFDLTILKLFTSEKYQDYFYISYFSPELKPLITEDNLDIIRDYHNNSKYCTPDYSAIKTFNKQFLSILPEDFDKNRALGENHTLICKYIRDDDIENFIIHVGRYSISLDSLVCPSIYESNYIIGHKIKNLNLIQYASFFGSVQIFRYLLLNGAEFSTDEWILSVYGYNPELISYLIDGFKTIVNPQEMYKAAIKSHHNIVANYIQRNYLDPEEQLYRLMNNAEENDFSYSLHYRNFAFFPKKNDCFNIRYYAAKFNYFNIVEFLYQQKKYDLSKEHVFFLIFLFNSNESSMQ